MTYKNPSVTYISGEASTERKPAEIYHIWRDGGKHYYYTSGDGAVIYGGNTYVPAPISRDTVQYDAETEINTLRITVGRLAEPIPEFITMNPVEILWIDIMKLHRDQSPYEASTAFYGQIRNVTIKGLSADVTCVGFESYLGSPVPVYRYGPQCNWTVFDDNCTLDEDSYKTEDCAVTVSLDGLQLTSDSFSGEADGYFTIGNIVSGEHERMVMDHTGDIIQIRYPVSTLATGGNVVIYAGCDGDIETCRDRFSNVVNFGGHPYIPLDNPTTWE